MKYFSGIIAFILLLLCFTVFDTVPAGHRGVLVTLGRVSDVSLEEGFHWKLPIVSDIKKVNVQTQKSEVTADSASKDLQQVTTTIALNYRIRPDEAHNIYKNIGGDYEYRVIAPAIEEAVKSATSKFTAEELITKRNEVKDFAKEALSRQLQPFYIDLTELSIVNFSFSEEFDRAVEAKVTAEQRALEAENKLKQVTFEQQAEIEKSKALAEKSRLEAQALQNDASAKNLTNKIEAEAFKILAEKWNGQLPNNTVLGGTVADKLINALSNR